MPGLASALAAQVSFPEKTIADCTRSSLNDAAKAKERADTLGKVPGFADALDAAAVTAGHVDAITSKAKPLTDHQRAEYFDRVAGLVDVASAATVEEFRRRLAMEARATERDDGIDRFERQRRKTVAAGVDRRRRHVAFRRPLRPALGRQARRPARSRRASTVRRSDARDVSDRSGA